MNIPLSAPHTLVRKGIIYILLITFIFSGLPRIPAEAQDIRLPVPGVRISISPPVDPPLLKGVKVHPDNPFRFDFILDKGDSGIADDQLKSESTKLIKYFLASITVPEKDLWVNLSPYEKDRIIPKSFGLTEMGRDLLAEDYMLKEITASLIYPDGEVGKKFWKRIYAEAAKKYGTTNIPLNTFNKVWIIPEKAVVYENMKADTAYVVESKLKVMLEEDYLSLQKHSDVGAGSQPAKERAPTRGAPTVNNLHSLASQIVREIVIPELTTEINQGKNFAQLRQVYNSLILATWYKKKIKDSILTQVYADRNKVAGVSINDVGAGSPGPSFRRSRTGKPALERAPTRGAPTEILDTNTIYQRYLRAFKKGVYNYIKEEQDPVTQEVIPRKYFSGGVELEGLGSPAMNTSLKAQEILKITSDPGMLSTLSSMGKRLFQITIGLNPLVRYKEKKKFEAIANEILRIEQQSKNTPFLRSYLGSKSWEFSQLPDPLILGQLHNISFEYGLEQMMVNGKEKWILNTDFTKYSVSNGEFLETGQANIEGHFHHSFDTPIYAVSDVDIIINHDPEVPSPFDLQGYRLYKTKRFIMSPKGVTFFKLPSMDPTSNRTWNEVSESYPTIYRSWLVQRKNIDLLVTNIEDVPAKLFTEFLEEAGFQYEVVPWSQPEIIRKKIQQLSKQKDVSEQYLPNPAMTASRAMIHSLISHDIERKILGLSKVPKLDAFSSIEVLMGQKFAVAIKASHAEMVEGYEGPHENLENSSLEWFDFKNSKSVILEKLPIGAPSFIKIDVINERQFVVIDAIGRPFLWEIQDNQVPKKIEATEAIFAKYRPKYILPEDLKIGDVFNSYLIDPDQLRKKIEIFDYYWLSYGEGRGERKKKKRFNVYVYGKKTFIVWPDDPHKDMIYQVLDNPSESEIEEISEKFKTVLDTVDEYIRKIELEQKHQAWEQRNQLLGDLYLYLKGMEKGVGGFMGLRKARYYNDMVAQFMEDVERMGLRRWIDERAKYLNLILNAKQDSLATSWITNKQLAFYIGVPLEKNGTYINNEDPIVLEHNTLDVALPDIIRLGGLGSQDYTGSKGIHLRSGERADYTPERVSFYSVSEIKAGWPHPSHSIAFEYPMIWGVVKSNTEDPRKFKFFYKGEEDHSRNMDMETSVGGFATERGVADFVPLKKKGDKGNGPGITHVFVPYFAVAEVDGLLKAHGFDIHVLPMTFDKDGKPIYDPAQITIVKKNAQLVQNQAMPASRAMTVDYSKAQQWQEDVLKKIAKIKSEKGQGVEFYLRRTGKFSFDIYSGADLCIGSVDFNLYYFNRRIELASGYINSADYQGKGIMSRIAAGLPKDADIVFSQITNGQTLVSLAKAVFRQVNLPTDIKDRKQSLRQWFSMRGEDGELMEKARKNISLFLYDYYSRVNQERTLQTLEDLALDERNHDLAFPVISIAKATGRKNIRIEFFQDRNPRGLDTLETMNVIASDKKPHSVYSAMRANRAMNGQRKTGGIDLTSRQFVQTQNSGGQIKFHIDQAMLQQLQESPGFEVRIIKMEPFKDIYSFLEIKLRDTQHNSN